MNEMRDLIIYKPPVVKVVPKVEIEDKDQIMNMANILLGTEVINKPAVE